MSKLFAGFLGLVMLMGATMAKADDDELHRVITVTGEGKISAVPDMATINTGVTTENKSAQEAVKQNSAAMEKLLGVLKEQGVADKDVLTSSFQVHPVYQHDPRGEKPPVVTGYRVSNTVQVRVRKLEDLGKILDAVIQAGSNQISGINFSLAEPEPVLAKARELAVKNARSRAEIYAGAAGVKVGKVMQINETVNFPQPMPYAGLAMAMDKASAVPIAVGEQEMSVSIKVVYMLVDGE